MSIKVHLNIILFSVVVALNSCEMFPCEVTLLKENKIPRSDLKYVIFKVGCGATTQDSYQISIINAADKVSDSLRGNVLITEGLINVDTDVYFNKEMNVLEIKKPDSAKTYKKAQRVANIKISYK